MVEKEVRTSVETISSTIETRRSHMMPRLTASKVCPFMVRTSRSHFLALLKLCDEVVVPVHGGHLTRTQNTSALALLDQRRAFDRRSRRERVPVVDRPLRHSPSCCIVGEPGALERLCGTGRPRQTVAATEVGSRRRRLNLPIDDFDRLVEPQRVGELVCATE